MGTRNKVDLNTISEFSQIIGELNKITQQLNQVENEFVMFHYNGLHDNGANHRISPKEIIFARSMHRVHFTMTHSTSPENEASIFRQESKKLNLRARIRKAKRSRNHKETRRKQKLNFPKWNIPASKPAEINPLAKAPWRDVTDQMRKKYES